MMKVARYPCLHRRTSGIYYFRRAVPDDLREQVGKTEWKSSLRTRDLGKAHQRANALYERSENVIRQLRGEASSIDPIVPDVAATDEQVVALGAAIMSRHVRMALERTDTRIRNAQVTGSDAQALLGRLMEELAEMENASPLYSEPQGFDYVLRQIEERALRKISDDDGLKIKLRREYWNARKDLLTAKIAQLQEDRTSYERIVARRRREPTLRALTELFIKHRGARWSPSTRRKVDNVVTVLLKVLGPDRKLSTIERSTARDLGDVLHDLPPNFSKRSVLRGLSAQQAARRARELDLPRMTRTTIKDYYNHINAIFEFGEEEQMMEFNPMRKLSVYAETSKKPRIPFSKQDIRKLFAAPIFTGCVDDERNWRKQGRNVVKRGRYWVPIIALHTGMRLNEICSLRARDVRIEHDTPIIEVTNSDGRRVKTKNAVRVVPIHSQLVRLGFVKWIADQEFGPDDDLFAELRADSAGARSNSFSKWFGRFTRAIDVYEEGKTFHSFRHLFRDLLRHANVSVEHVERIMGWSNSSMQSHYGSGPQIKALQSSIEQVDPSIINLSHLISHRRRKISD